MATTKVTADDFKQILTDALTSVRGISQEALVGLTAEFAPRLAGLATSDDPSGEFDDIRVNETLALEILGVKAESVPGQAALAAIRVAANVAMKFVVAA